MQPALGPTLYEQLEALPQGLTGEILKGQGHTQPRPSGPHARVASRFDRTIGRCYDDGIDGPGGWWIFVEPEVHFRRDVEVAVPDLAGWRRERMPDPPRDQRFEVVPDWACEILSPSTGSKDREVKMPLYARYAVAFAWLVDPQARTLEAYQLQGGDWQELGRFAGADQVAVPPFEAVTIDLGELWLPLGPEKRRATKPA
jgi:Uma2 family endonuclease